MNTPQTRPATITIGQPETLHQLDVYPARGVPLKLVSELAPLLGDKLLLDVGIAGLHGPALTLSGVVAELFRLRAHDIGPEFVR
jgi:hypothetical protein